MRVLILGANGQLGSDLVKVFQGHSTVPLAHDDLDVCDFQAVREAVSAAAPNVVINTAAYHRVDDCEDDFALPFKVNAEAVRNLAQCCATLDCVLAHVSTDYVFGGEKTTPYTETDLPGPINVYGASKLAGEYFARSLCPRHFIVRTSGLYGVAGASGKGGNFVELMVRLAKEGKPIRVVDDQVLTPTYTYDLALAMKELVSTEVYGTYHVTNVGQCSWFEFAAKIFDLLRWEVDLTPTTTRAFGAKARRPSHSVLDNAALRNVLGRDLRVWPQALRDYLQAKGHLAAQDAAA